MEKRSAGAQDYLPGILVAAIGIAVNVYLFLVQQNRVKRLYDTADSDLARHQISRYVLWFILFCIAAYLLQMILPKIRFLSMLIPLADLALWGMTLWTLRGLEHPDAKLILFSILLSVLAFILIWFAVLLKSPEWALLALIAAAGYCTAAILLHGIDTKAAGAFVICNSVLNALILMIMRIIDHAVSKEETYGIHEMAAPRERAVREAAAPRESAVRETGAPREMAASHGTSASRRASGLYQPAASLEVPGHPESPAGHKTGTPSVYMAKGGFFAQETYVIDKKLRTFGKFKVYKICNLPGDVIGVIRERTTGGVKAPGAMPEENDSGSQEITYRILDRSESVQFFVTITDGIEKASISDAGGKRIAELAGGLLKDGSGLEAGKVRNDVSVKGKLDIYDPKGKKLGTVLEKRGEDAKEALIAADQYYVSTASEISREQKILVLGTALIYEMDPGNQ